MVFNEASKVDVGTPVRMKGVQIGNITSVALHASHVEAMAQVADASNIIPQVRQYIQLYSLGACACCWVSAVVAGCSSGGSPQGSISKLVQHQLPHQQLVGSTSLCRRGDAAAVACSRGRLGRVLCL
jgi:hypothetical protein